MHHQHSQHDSYIGLCYFEFVQVQANADPLCIPPQLQPVQLSQYTVPGRALKCVQFYEFRAGKRMGDNSDQGATGQVQLVLV